MEHIFVNVCEEKFTIKEELLDVTEQQEETDRAQRQLESTLESQHNMVVNKYEDSELKDVKNITINSEILDRIEQSEDADLQVQKPIKIIKENKSDEEGSIDDVSKASVTFGDLGPAMHKDRVACEAIKQEWKDLSVTPLTYGSNGLHFKEHRVVLDDGMLTLRKQNTQECFEEATDNDMPSLKVHPTINQKTLTNSNNMDTDSASTTEAAKFIYPGLKNIQGSPKNINKKPRFRARTSTVKGNIDLTRYDAESSKNVFICDICLKSYKRKISLYKHIQGHLNLFNCTHCSYTGNTKSILNIHINTKHPKSTVYNCSYCSYRTCDRRHLTSHVNSRHTKNTVYNCSYCSYSTYDRRHLSSHVNSQHTKSTVYNCSYCDYKAYVRSCLSNHVNSRHTKNTVYNCSYCSYSAYDRSALSSHVNSQHTKNTVYNCSHCDYKTFNKHNLSRHINAVHTKINVFTCSYCKYKTYDKYTLPKHINSKHNKNTVLKCDHCSYETHDKRNLRKHIKAKHNK